MLAKGIVGLVQDSVALCHEVTTLDRGKLRDLIGTLDQASMAKVEDALKVALELD
jgi:mRNA-degrading endonuclease toxin of MazEF toxin-antitoxin module